MEDYSPTCPGCTEMHARRDPAQLPPCETCRVELIEENADAELVYQMAKRQVRIAPGSGQIIDLDYAAVKAIMDIYEIADQRTCFMKVARAFHHILAERQRKD